MKIKIIAGALLLLACILAGTYMASRKGHTLRDLETEIGTTFPRAGEFIVQKDILREGGPDSSRSIEGRRGNTLLKIEIATGLSEVQAAQKMGERLAMIQSLYSNIPAAYPGMVSNTVTMADALQPEVKEVVIGAATFPLYILTSNSRYTYGAMTEDTAAYRGGLCFLFNSSTGTLYRFDYFTPKDEFAEEELLAFFAEIRPETGRLVFPAAGQVKPALPPPREAGPSAGTEGPLQFKDYNLILIAPEPLGANHVSSYGYAAKTTPNLDAFAKSAFQFNNAVSAASWSLPSFMSWFTSLYPSRHKVTNKYSTFSEEKQVLANLTELSPGVATLAQVLRENGYRTAGFTGNASLSREYGFALGFEEYFDGQRFGGFDLTMPKALDWLAAHQNEKVFLFVQGYDVHGQYPLARQYLPQFLSPEYHGPFKGSEEEYWDLRTRNIEKGKISITEEDMRLWRAVYDAKIYAADQRLGAFLRKLQETGLLEKSIVIISSGSGNEYGEHGRIDHGFSLYEELVHVPLWMRIPGQHGQVSDLVRTIDIMPTVFDLLAVPLDTEVRKQMQGVSLTPLLAGEHLDLAGISETDYLLHTFKRSIRTGDGWKLIVTLDTEERELFNLKDDPGEQKNLIGSEGRLAYELEHRIFSELGSNANSR